MSKTPISFDRFIRNVMQARYSDYRKLPDAQVDSEPEFNKMRDYILHFYKGHIPVQSLASFDKQFGWTYSDCFPIQLQPSLPRRIGTPDFPAKPVPIRVCEIYVGSSGCPDGCIPMMRITLEQLVRFRKLDWFFSKDGKGGGGLPRPPRSDSH